MLATLARSFLSALVVVCAAVVAVCVMLLRALDARGFDRAGGMLAAMGARRVPRSVRVDVQRAPVNRRRVRELAGFALARYGSGDDVEADEESTGHRACPDCYGTGEGTFGRACGVCHGNGEVRVLSVEDADEDAPLRAWRIAAVAG